MIFSKDELGSDKITKIIRGEIFKDNCINIDLLSTDKLQEILGIFKIQKDNREQYKVKLKMKGLL